MVTLRSAPPRPASPPARRPRRGPSAGLLVLAVLLVAILLTVLLVAWQPLSRLARGHGITVPIGAPSGPQAYPSPTGELGDDDGYIASGGSIAPDADLPAITRLDPDLRAAMQQAARDAQADGVEFFITSGWRSARYQQHLLDAAVTRYGSEEEARRWVATPDTSAHVTGDAVDIGPTDADSWMQQHGSRYGLCQTYSNEMWHFQLAVEPGGVCPAPRSDAASG
jgi:zinc D-Ala-D-Ala carboxypeptidase